MKIDKYFHLYSRKDDVVFEEVEKPELKTGKWIEYDNSHCECPFCHTEWSYFDNEVEHFDFCPRCGAKMEETK